MAQLEIEYELQSKITKAAHQLIQENNDKNIRKTRQQTYQKELQKVCVSFLLVQKLDHECLYCAKDAEMDGTVAKRCCAGLLLGCPASTDGASFRNI